MHRTAKDNLVSIAKQMTHLPFEGAFDVSASILEAAQAIEDAHVEGLRQRYARLIESMSIAEAAKILGLSTSEATSPEAISKAYKAKALENHPDRGGDPVKMVDVNVARDTLLKASPSESGDSGDDDDSEAKKFLTENFDQMKNGRGWWISPHNLVFNETLTDRCNLWAFTILPMFPQKKAYSEKLGGIVIHPAWRPASKNDIYLDTNTIKKVYVAAKQAPTIQETAREELNWIETTFQIRIPADIQAKIVKDSLATAARRWGVDTLRLKDRLIPLDGSKPRDLSSWGF